MRTDLENRRELRSACEVSTVQREGTGVRLTSGSRSYQLDVLQNEDSVLPLAPDVLKYSHLPEPLRGSVSRCRAS